MDESTSARSSPLHTVTVATPPEATVKSDEGIMTTTLPPILGDHQWWAIQAHSIGATQAKSLFLHEVQMLSIVISLIMSSAYSKVFANHEDEQVFGTIDDRGKQCIAIVDHIIFFVCIMDMSVVVIIYAQLNVRVSGASVMHFFEDPSTAWYPTYLIYLTQIVLVLQCVSVCLWVFLNHPTYAAVLLACLYAGGIFLVSRVFVKLDSAITLELARLKLKAVQPEYVELHQTLKDADVADFAYDITAQVFGFHAGFKDMMA